MTDLSIHLYELKLINTITNLINIDMRTQPIYYEQFINKQKQTLINRLESIQKDNLTNQKIRKILINHFDYPENFQYYSQQQDDIQQQEENKDDDDDDDDKEDYEEEDEEDEFDQESDISEGDKFYSLRSWLEYYLSIDYDTAYELSIDHCNTIKNKYFDKYNKNPIKICKEWIYKNDEKIKQVFVNSFSRFEFLDIIKPYVDTNFMTETNL